MAELKEKVEDQELRIAKLEDKCEILLDLLNGLRSRNDPFISPIKFED